MSEQIDNPYAAVVVLMPYGKYAAQMPTLVDNARLNAGSEFNDVEFLRVAGGKGLSTVEEFRESIDKVIADIGVNNKTPDALSQIEEALKKKGYSTSGAKTIAGEPTDKI